MTSPRRCYCCSAREWRDDSSAAFEEEEEEEAPTSVPVRGKCRRGASAETAAFPRPTAVSDVETRERLWVSATAPPAVPHFRRDDADEGGLEAGAGQSGPVGGGRQPRARRG